MKYLMLALAFVSFNVFAETVSFVCKMTDATYIGQFSLEASIEYSNEEFVQADFNFGLRKAGRVSNLETFSVTRDGKVQIFEAGSFYPYKTMRLVSAVKGAELEYINLLINVPPLHSSQIRFVDGTTYFGSCELR